MLWTPVELAFVKQLLFVAVTVLYGHPALPGEREHSTA